jgi:hypothetical protein
MFGVILTLMRITERATVPDAYVTAEETKGTFHLHIKLNEQRTWGWPVQSINNTTLNSLMFSNAIMNNL